MELYRFEQHFVGDEGDKLAVGGFFVVAVYAYSEERIDVFYLASVPCHFYGVAYRAFDFGRTGIEFFRDFGIQFFCYAVYNVGIVYCEFYRFA